MPPTPAEFSSPSGPSAIAPFSAENTAGEFGASMQCVEPLPPAGKPVNIARVHVTTDTDAPPDEGQKYFKIFLTCGTAACSKLCGSFCPADRGDVAGSDVGDYDDDGADIFADSSAGPDNGNEDQPDTVDTDKPTPSAAADGGAPKST